MKRASRTAKRLFLFALIAVFIIVAFSGCGEIGVEEEGIPDYYVLFDKKDQKYHDQSCPELPMNNYLIKMEYESVIGREYLSCGWCEPDSVYSSGSYINRKYSLSERVQKFWSEEIDKKLDVFPDYSRYDGFWDYVGHVFLSDVLIQLPAAFLGTVMMAYNITFVFVFRLLVICVVIAVLAGIALLVYCFILKLKRRRNMNN